QGKSVDVAVRLISEEDFFDNKLLEKLIGIQVQPTEPGLIRQLGGGFVITKVTRGSRADKAGLKSDQLVVAINERQPRSIAEFAKYIFRKSSGEKLNFYYLYPRVRGRYITFHKGRSQIQL
ncbi:MAG: PDZ domain-containing protein, partial [Limisphaerales bacterium]